jgi:pimeloyl-ACP methyl ester carboxylesterase
MSMPLPIAKLTLATLIVVGGVANLPGSQVGAQSAPPAAAPLPDIGERKTITEAECTTTKLGTAVPLAAIGEPVSNVTLSEPRWTAAADPAPAYCTVDGTMAPIDPAAKPINFRVVLPASWTLRAAQLGGGGMNGIIPNLTGGRGGSVGPAQGIVTYGSDSGHSVKDAPEWTLVDETIRNLGYMQMKKTRDAAMVLVERAYGRKPAVNYYIGTSQGGREALTVAQRYPDDYDGIIANVPIVNFSSLMLAPGLIRIQEKPLANWITDAMRAATGAEIALWGGWAYRGLPIPAGNVDVVDLIQCSRPFDQYLVTVRMTGSEIKAILDDNVPHPKKDQPTRIDSPGASRLLQISGASYVFDVHAKDGAKIVSSTLVPERVYRVVMEGQTMERQTAFLAGRFRKLDYESTEVPFTLALYGHAARTGRIEARAEGRVRAGR